VQKNSFIEICFGCIWNSLFLFVRSLTFELKEWQLNPTAGFMYNVLRIGLVSLLIWSMAKVRRKKLLIQILWVVFGMDWFSGAFIL
jgi:hypothetical protein